MEYMDDLVRRGKEGKNEKTVTGRMKRSKEFTYIMHTPNSKMNFNTILSLAVPGATFVCVIPAANDAKQYTVDTLV